MNDEQTRRARELTETIDRLPQEVAKQLLPDWRRNVNWSCPALVDT